MNNFIKVGKHNFQLNQFFLKKQATTNSQTDINSAINSVHSFRKLEQSEDEMQKGNQSVFSQSVISKQNQNDIDIDIDNEINDNLSINFRNEQHDQQSKKLTKFFCQYFNEENINFYKFNFDIYEMKIMKAILQKKYSKANYFNKLLHSDNIQNLKPLFFQQLIELQNKPTQKRKEENNKFIFKLTLKKLRQNYQKNHITYNPKKDKKNFYQFYFGKDQFDNNIDIKEYYDPLNIKNKKTTLNNHYFKRIFSVEQFYQDFMNFVQNSFIKTYNKTVEQKFELFFENYYKECKLYGKQSACENFVLLIKKMKRLKLPWTKKDIDIAIIHFTTKIQKLLSKKYFPKQLLLVSFKKIQSHNKKCYNDY